MLAVLDRTTFADLSDCSQLITVGQNPAANS
jgi:hypothetical protein